ncbi:MAG: DUF4340 domain-containing protein [Anaerolineales bacterium]|nr:DUF4340 domain-containing protein [Anaerolineales bacterium]
MPQKTTQTTATKKPRKTVKPQAAPPPEPKVYPTSVRSTTWIAFVAFIALVALAVYLNRKAQNDILSQPTPTAIEKTFLLPKDLVSSVEVKSATGETVKIERGADKAWALILPEKAAADSAACEAAATQVGALSIDASLDNVANLADFGLKEPAYTITISFENGKSNTLAVGAVTPSETAYYVQLDKGGVNAVSKSGLDALLNLLTAPPYQTPPTAVPSS